MGSVPVPMANIRTAISTSSIARSATQAAKPATDLLQATALLAVVVSQPSTGNVPVPLVNTITAVSPASVARPATQAATHATGLLWATVLFANTISQRSMGNVPVVLVNTSTAIPPTSTARPATKAANPARDLLQVTVLFAKADIAQPPESVIQHTVLRVAHVLSRATFVMSAQLAIIEYVVQSTDSALVCLDITKSIPPSFVLSAPRLARLANCPLEESCA